jgi:maltodextrin utilization protein YvdJ
VRNQKQRVKRHDSQQIEEKKSYESNEIQTKFRINWLSSNNFNIMLLVVHFFVSMLLVVLPL